MKGSEEFCTEAYHVLPLLKDNLALWKVEEARQESDSKEVAEEKAYSPQSFVCFFVKQGFSLGVRIKLDLAVVL